MPDASSPSPDLADVATLAAALDWDAQRPAAERADFDRRVGRREGRSGDRHADVTAWLNATCSEDTHLRQLRGRLRANLQWAAFLLFALGTGLGAMATLGAFYYQGAGRVNVVAVLGVLVVLPALFLLAFFWAALPSAWIAWLPGGRAGTHFLRGLNLGRLGWALFRRLPQKWRASWEAMMQHADRHQALYAKLQKWAVLRWSQLFALGFQLAALVTAGGLVVFSDLVFGWSTTLASGDPSADAETLKAITDLVAAPWHWALQSAAPGLSLIEESRFYRAASPTLTPGEAARLGQWWPFVLASMLVYGLLPRLLTTWLAAARLRSATRTAFTLTPGVTSVLNRLHAAQVETTEPGPAPSPAASRDAVAKPDPLPGAAPDDYAVAVNWAGVPLAGEALDHALGGIPVLAAGGTASLAADQSVLQSLSEEHPEGAIAVLVKSWEPPLLELIDFLKELRNAVGPGREVVVLAVALDTDGALEAPPDRALDVWQRQLSRARDPWLQVFPLLPAEASR
jgi:hypothetical protein